MIQAITLLITFDTEVMNLQALQKLLQTRNFYLLLKNVKNLLQIG